MRLLACLLLLTATAGAFDTLRAPNSCHVNSVAFKAALHLRKHDVWARVLLVKGHAVCVYQSGRWLYVYDHNRIGGSVRLTRNLSWKGQPKRLARLLNYDTGYFE